jgi:hypothetical protein
MVKSAKLYFSLIKHQALRKSEGSGGIIPFILSLPSTSYRPPNFTSSFISGRISAPEEFSCYTGNQIRISRSLNPDLCHYTDWAAPTANFIHKVR